MKKSIFPAMAVILSLMLVSTVRAEFLQYNIQAVLLVKLLVYDNNLLKNVKSETIKIGVLTGGDEKSIAKAKEMSLELSKLKSAGVKINDNMFDIIPLKMSSVENLSNELKASGINVLYVVSNKATDIAAIVAVTHELKIMSISGDEADNNVARGISVGLELNSGKPSILVNLTSAMGEGCDFSSQFLTLVKIVK
jgi:YfiR/HmsC-like